MSTNKTPKTSSESQQYTILSKQSIRLVGEIAGYDDLPNDVIDKICEEVNYRIREVTQLGLDIMKQARRKRLLASDINMSLEYLDVQPVFGFGHGSEELRYLPLDHENLFYPEDKSVDLFQLLSEDVSLEYVESPVVKRSWLAVEGLPIPINNAEGASISWPALTEDEKNYCDLITDKLFQMEDQEEQNDVLKNIRRSSFVNRLLPHILDFLVKKMEEMGPSNTTQLLLLVQFLRALVTNSSVNLLFTPFLDVVATMLHRCQVGIHGDSLDIWDLQESASQLMSIVLRLWDSPLNNIEACHEEFLLGVLSSPSQPLGCYYGAVMGLLFLKMQSLEKSMSLLFNILQQTLNDISSFHQRDVDRLLEVSKLAIEKVLKHHMKPTSVAGDATSCLTLPMKVIYLFSEELFGDSLSLKLPLMESPSKTEEEEEITLHLPGKESGDTGGEDMLRGLMSDGSQRGGGGGGDDVSIKAILSDSPHGIKLKISKCSKQSKDAATESLTVDATLGDAKSKRPTNVSKKNSISVADVFDEVQPPRGRDDVVIAFRFKNQSNLNTFTERKKAEILARNMTKQHAATSRYRELANNLRPFSRSSLLFAKLHTKKFKTGCHVPSILSVI